MRSVRSVALAALLAAPAALHAQSHAPPRAPDADAQAIRAKILTGARGFMIGNPDTVLAHYARDIVLSYPGIPDMDYATLARSYGELRRRPAGERAETTPTFDEVLVSGDMAIVRVRWTTTITDSTGRANTRRLRDLQVWRRERDGEWMFIRGMHYREPTQ
jgi:steroid delta-isomerase